MLLYAVQKDVLQKGGYPLRFPVPEIIVSKSFIFLCILVYSQDANNYSRNIADDYKMSLYNRAHATLYLPFFLYFAGYSRHHLPKAKDSSDSNSTKLNNLLE